ncbi:MAG TPA: hypothetical protein VEC35_16625 [Noviherbaspirillum sp.]|nr:hypothetical protein [Noviherbaspirillum sp.]
MNKLVMAIPISALAAGIAFAQSSAGERLSETEKGAASQSPSRDAGADTSGTSGTAGSRASGGPAITEGNKALGTTIRGTPDSATTSDRETSRTWSGVGSTGGATGTGTSSGTTEDAQTSGGGESGTSASGNSAGDARVQTPNIGSPREPGGSRGGR